MPEIPEVVKLEPHTSEETLVEGIDIVRLTEIKFSTRLLNDILTKIESWQMKKTCEAN